MRFSEKRPDKNESRDRFQMSQHLKACRSRIQELETEVRITKRDLKQFKRHVQTYEILAASHSIPGDELNALARSDSVDKTSWHPRMLDVLQEFKMLSDEKSAMRTQITDLRCQLEKLWQGSVFLSLKKQKDL